MIKKLLVVCFALASMAVLAEAAFDVYDIKCAFKRIEPVLRTIKAEGVNSYHLSYKTVSDNWMGYLVVKSCCGDADACAECGDSNIFGKDENDETTAYIYIYRKSEKKEKDLLFKAPVLVAAGVFGDGYNDAYIDTPSRDKILKKAKQGYLSVVIDIDAFEELSQEYIAGSRDIEYGFLGYTCEDGTMILAGFGAVDPVTKKTAATSSLCGSTPATTSFCYQLKSISGSMVGSFNYSNTALCESCDETSIMDLCDYLFTRKTNATVNGTWTLKINNALSKKYMTIEEIDEVMLKKCGKAEIKDSYAEDPAKAVIENMIVNEAE